MIDEILESVEKILPEMCYPYAMSFAHTINETGTDFEHFEIVVNKHNHVVIYDLVQPNAIKNIVTCVNAVPALCAEIRRLRATGGLDE